MEDTVKTERKAMAIALAQLLEDEKGIDTVALSLVGHSSWTDYFVVTTGNSVNHMMGLVDTVSRWAADQGLEMKSGFKQSREQPWMLVDCNDIVVHVMSHEAREFYSLEDCWFQADVVFQSSKSS